jgi:hypothetical protein
MFVVGRVALCHIYKLFKFLQTFYACARWQKVKVP